MISHVCEARRLLDRRHVCPRLRGRGIEDSRIPFSAEDIDRAVAEVQIEIEDEGAGDGPFPVQPLQGDGHIVEVAEAPGAPGRGVVSGRTDESEARFDEARFRSLNGAARGKGGDFIQSLALHVLHMGRFMDGKDISGLRRLRRHEVDPALERRDDRSDSPRRGCRVGGVFVVESFVEKDLHGSSLRSRATCDLLLNIPLHLLKLLLRDLSAGISPLEDIQGTLLYG